MELDELKNSWNELNKRLENSEVVNLRMVKEIVTQKTRSAFERIFNLNLYNLVVAFIIIVMVFPWVYMNEPISTTSFVIVETAMVFGLIPMVRKIVLLLKFDLDGKKSYELSRLVLQYKKTCQQETLWTTAIVALTMVAFYVSELVFNTEAGYVMSSRIWLVVALTLLTFAFAYIIGLWQRRRHSTQMQEIESGLQELREFEPSDAATRA